VTVVDADLRESPKGKGAFADDEHVECKYDHKMLGGHTPKFACLIAGEGEPVKVKYGVANGEIYAGVAAARLMSAVGFGADRMYPVWVTCQGCPIDPWKHPLATTGQPQDFFAAVIERKHKGHTIAVKGHKGWSFKELDLIDQTQGGATLAERDALRLMTVLLQHGDSRDDNQAFVCSADGEDGCSRPLLYIHDLGGSFGGAGKLSLDEDKFNYREWSNKPIWRDEPGCVGNLNAAINGTLKNPKIHEAGRKFLADLLAQLSDQQIADVFAAAHAERRIERFPGSDRNVTVDDWAAAFKAKRDPITERRCPE
jgi:hypothetical protein